MQNLGSINPYGKEINSWKKIEIVVRPADKGGWLVVLNKDNYNTEIQRLLDDMATYQKRTYDPTLSLKYELTCWANNGLDEGLFTQKKIWSHLFPRVPVLYIIPEIRKSKDNPPGQPIVSGIGSLYSRVGEYLYIYFKPLVEQSPSYLKDSWDLILLIQKKLSYRIHHIGYCGHRVPTYQY